MRWSLLAAALLSAAPPQTAGTSPVRLAVNMTTIESAPVFLAARNSVGMTLRSGGIPVLLDGDADAATNSETQALIRSVARPDLRIVMTVAECDYRIVARRSAGVAQPGDLRGRRIGTPPNTSSAYYLARVLETVRLSERDVTIVPMAVAEMGAAMKRGDVDAVSGWEPGARDSVTALGEDAIVFQPRGLYRELFNLNTTTAVLSDPVRHRALVDAVRTIVVASGQIRERPKSVWPLLSSRINVPEAAISDAWSYFRFPASRPSDMVDVLVEEERWVAGVQKWAPRARWALQSLVDDSVLREARSQLR